MLLTSRLHAARNAWRSHSRLSGTDDPTETFLNAYYLSTKHQVDLVLAREMAAQSAHPKSQSKSTSRWGSLLQQAVAGVESRLDNILADEDSFSAAVIRKETVDQPRKTATMTVPTKKSATNRILIPLSWK